MQIAKMKDYESIKRLRNFGQPDVVVPHFDLGGVLQPRPYNPVNFRQVRIIKGDKRKFPM